MSQADAPVTWGLVIVGGDPIRAVGYSAETFPASACRIPRLPDCKTGTVLCLSDPLTQGGAYTASPCCLGTSPLSLSVEDTSMNKSMATPGKPAWSGTVAWTPGATMQTLGKLLPGVGSQGEYCRRERQYHTASLVAGGRIMLLGGEGSPGTGEIVPGKAM